MSNLRNLYISQSFFGVVNLENSLQPLTSASGDTQLQDGLGENLGVIINSGSNTITLDRNVNVSDNLIVSGNAEFKGNVDVSGSWIHTGSIDVLGNVTIVGNVSANIATFDTVNTRILHVLEESASVIFSSGSNVLGDEASDTQTLIGQVIVSGTLGVNGNSSFTGSLTVSNEISSSTVNGIGNVTIYSASVASRLDQLEVSSGSQDSQLSNLEIFTSSQENINSGYNSFTSSADVKFTTIGNVTSSLNAFTASQQNINAGYNAFTASVTQSLTDVSASFEVGQLVQDQRLDSLEIYTGSVNLNYIERAEYNVYTASIEVEQTTQDSRLNQLSTETGSINGRLNNIELTTASLQTEINGLSSFTGSYATTGSNTFDGTQVITGSVYGNIISSSITSNTASFDCSLGNFFTLTLPATQTYLEAGNIQPGQTVSIKITNATTSSAVVLDTSFKFGNQIPYVPTNIINAIDVITFVSYDASSLLGVSTLNIG